jgi:hypothetical protein
MDQEIQSFVSAGSSWQPPARDPAIWRALRQKAWYRVVRCRLQGQQYQNLLSHAEQVMPTIILVMIWALPEYKRSPFQAT